MFLLDCIRLVRKYYPSEYEDYEMYIWCNEVTAMLAAETDGEYQPVRLPKYHGFCEFGADYLTTDFSAFDTGDTINISVNDGEYIYSEVPVLETEYDDERYKLYTAENIFGDVAASENVVITRCITDETYCDAPFDGMYTYYILAKICLLQHDIDMYNQYMNMFNSLFEQYKKQRISRQGGGENRFINWWNSTP